MSQLRELVAVWQSACADFSALVKQLGDADWGLPTDCPGWSVRDVLAHSAALESELAGNSVTLAGIPEDPAHVRNPMGRYTERGVVARRDRDPADLIAEFDDAVARRAELLAGEPLDNPDGDPPITPGQVGWSWLTLLRNRPLDVWVHEQDIRRAVGRPGGLDSDGARHSQAVLAAALPYVVARLAQAPPGSTVVVDVTGPVSAMYGVAVGDDRRGRSTDATMADPTIRLTMDTASFTTLGAGRRKAATLPIKVDGDSALADRVLDAMAVTP